MTTKKEFVFWDVYEQAQTQCNSTSACAYAAVLTLRMLQNCNIDLSKKDLEEIIIIVRSKFVRQKITRVLAELRRAAQSFQNRHTGSKTLLSRLRKQALQEIQNI